MRSNTHSEQAQASQALLMIGKTRKIPNKVFNTTIRRLVKVAEAPWRGAPTVLLNEPRASGAGAGSLEYWTLAKEFHNRVQEMRREFGVKEHPRLLSGRR